MNLIIAFIFLSGASAALYHSVNRGLLSKAATRLISQNSRIAAGSSLHLNRAAFSTFTEFSGKSILGKDFIMKIDSKFYCKMINNENYKNLLSNRDYFGIAQAYERNQIDYTYIPKVEKFYLVLLDMIGPEGHQILQKYFEHRTFDKMYDMGVVDYNDLLIEAYNRKNYYIADLAALRLTRYFFSRFFKYLGAKTTGKATLGFQVFKPIVFENFEGSTLDNVVDAFIDRPKQMCEVYSSDKVFDLIEFVRGSEKISQFYSAISSLTPYVYQDESDETALYFILRLYTASFFYDIPRKYYIDDLKKVACYSKGRVEFNY